MNRNITLIISALVVVILLCVWLYLMFFATPTNDTDQNLIEGEGQFTEFEGLGNDAANETGVEGGNNNTGNEDGTGYNPAILRQLTTKNIIGYAEVEIASTSHIVYMESGVGHIYGINLETGVEERLSATTIPDARDASFSFDGSMIVIKTGDTTGVNPLSFATIDYDLKELSVEQIIEEANQFVFLDDNKILYTTQENNSLVGAIYNPETKSEKILFETPFREAMVAFGSNTNDSHFFYPKTSHLLEGFVYQTNSSSMKRLPIDGFGLTTAVLGGNLISTYRDGIELVTTIYNHESGISEDINNPLIPTKCVSDNGSHYCALPSKENLRYDTIDNWNRGTKSFADNLWAVSENNEQLIDITSFSGRNVDVFNGEIGRLSSDWYFQNKVDNTLWIYELSRRTDIVNENTI